MRIIRLLLCIAVIAACPGAAQDNDCYFTEREGTWLLGNSKIEIRLDARNGGITGLLNKTSKRQMLAGGAAEVFVVRYSTGNLTGAQAREVWNAVGGPYIRSAVQSVASRRFEKTAKGAVLEVVYDRLLLDGKPLEAAPRYRIELAAGSEQTLWTLSLENRTGGTFSEVLFPVVAGVSKLDTLIMPNQSGEKLSNPFDKIGDERPAIYLEYPARASMQWFDYFSRDSGLYLASYDRNLTYTTLNFGRAPGVSATGMWIGKAAFVAAGTSWTSPPIALGIHAGDWHAGADFYREWIESWVPKPQVAPRIRKMLGGLREIQIRNPAERPLNRYEDIMPFAEDVLKSPLPGAFMVSGWMYNGHDTYFPEYNPIPELGGAAALTAALDKVRALGLATSGYINGRLCNHETETYRRFGRKWAALGKTPGLGVTTVDLFEIQEQWNQSWDKTRRGEGRFAVMCPSAAGWQDHIVGEMVKMIRDYRFDGLFIDQPGSYYAQLCYASHHGHSNPGTAWGPGYFEIFRRAREQTRKINPESFLWTEGMNDVFNQFLDYTMDKSLGWEPMRSHPEVESFVEMWRYTLPWYVTGNHSGNYSFKPSKDPVYGDGFFFVNGIRGADKSLRRGRDPQRAAARAAYIDRIASLWEKGSEFLVDGRFMDDVGLTVSNPAVLAKLYRSGSGFAVALWNTSAAPVKLGIAIDPARAGVTGPVGAGSALGGTPLRQERRAPGIQIEADLEPHAVDLVVFRARRDQTRRFKGPFLGPAGVHSRSSSS